MFSSKKAVVTLTTFSLVIVASVLVLSFSYFFYDLSKDRAEQYSARLELATSINSLRTELVSLLSHPNSSLSYHSDLDPSEIEMELSSNYILAKKAAGSDVISINSSSLGIGFCQKYFYRPVETGVFSYNGSCLSLN